MEIDFDKEIDTLLRKARSDGPVLVGDAAASGHLDADEISAFAENMLPERSRAMYMSHVADCDRCRKILSNVLVMNAEAAPKVAAAPGVIQNAKQALPWYRRLLLFPNLAYVMGGLILVFAGFLGFTVIQNTGGGDSAVVSQITENETRSSGPNFQTDEIPAAAPSADMAANANVSIATNAISNSAANRSTEPAAPGERGPTAESAMRGQNFAIDGTDVHPQPPPPAMERAAAKPVAKERDEALADTVAAPSAAAGAAAQNRVSNDSRLMRQAPNTATQSQSGPMRNSENQYNRQLENMDVREAEKKKAERNDAEEIAGRRAVGGRTFERKQGVWYDVAYQGSQTINVRRRSAEFNRLDSGLRTIANSLSGTIVVVWESKAYRIQ